MEIHIVVVVVIGVRDGIFQLLVSWSSASPSPSPSIAIAMHERGTQLTRLLGVKEIQARSPPAQLAPGNYLFYAGRYHVYVCMSHPHGIPMRCTHHHPTPTSQMHIIGGGGGGVANSDNIAEHNNSSWLPPSFPPSFGIIPSHQSAPPTRIRVFDGESAKPKNPVRVSFFY